MRMWMVDPSFLCRKHLLGEHVECHMFVGTILKNISLAGYVEKGLVEVHNLKERHAILAAEMEKRGYSHKSHLVEFPSRRLGKVDRMRSLEELAKCCPECRSLQFRNK